MSDLVSIIVVNWNGRKWLKKCLDSLMDQDKKSFEVILVDNASSDGSAGYVSSEYPSVRVIAHDENVGFARAVNAAVRQAKGERVLLFNNDAWVEKDFLEKITAFYDANGFDVVAPYEADYEGVFDGPYTTGIDRLGHPLFSRDLTRDNFYLSGACLLFQKSLYERTGGFDEDFFMYCEEVDWFWRLNLCGKTFGYCGDSLLYHRGAGSSASGINPRIFLWRNRHTLMMLLKNYEARTLLWVLPLYVLQNIAEIIFFAALFRPDISFTYLQGWTFSLRRIASIAKKRASVRSMRLLDDRRIFRKMYTGPAKIHHFARFLELRKKRRQAGKS